MSKFRFIISWRNSLGHNMARLMYIDGDKYYIIVCTCRGKSNGKIAGFSFTINSSVYAGTDLPYDKNLFTDMEVMVYNNISRFLPEVQNNA